MLVADVNRFHPAKDPICRMVLISKSDLNLNLHSEYVWWQYIAIMINVIKCTNAINIPYIISLSTVIANIRNAIANFNITSRIPMNA